MSNINLSQNTNKTVGGDTMFTNIKSIIKFFEDKLAVSSGLYYTDFDTCRQELGLEVISDETVCLWDPENIGTGRSHSLGKIGLLYSDMVESGRSRRVTYNAAWNLCKIIINEFYQVFVIDNNKDMSSFDYMLKDVTYRMGDLRYSDNNDGSKLDKYAVTSMSQLFDACRQIMKEYTNHLPLEQMLRIMCNNKVTNHPFFDWNDPITNRIDKALLIKFYSGQTTIREIVCRRLYDDIPEITNKEITTTINRLMKNKQRHWYNTIGITELLTDIIDKQCKFNDEKEREQMLSYVSDVYERTSTRLVAEWVMKKGVKVFQKEIIVYGPARRVITRTYADVLEHVREADLRNGVKTSIEAVMTSVQERMMANRQANMVEFPKASYTNNEHVYQITNSEDLEAEGKEMGHCVATYQDACEKQACYIYTIITEDNERSTFEIAVETSTYGKIDIVQHRGKENVKPSERHSQILKSWVKEQGCKILRPSEL